MSSTGTSEWSLRQRAMLEETLIPSPNSVDLEHSPESAYFYRLGGGPPQIAELFHENSKLSALSPASVPPSAARLDEVRDWFFSTAYAIRKEDLTGQHQGEILVTTSELPAHVGRLLEPLMAGAAPSLWLYALDLLLLHRDRLLRVIPGQPNLWVEKRLSASEGVALRRAVLGLTPATLERTETFLFVVGCPWRYMMLWGPRGYRHTLFDAGRLLLWLQQQAERVGVTPHVTHDFHDARLERILILDGTERSALAAVALPGAVE